MAKTGSSGLRLRYNASKPTSTDQRFIEAQADNFGNLLVAFGASINFIQGGNETNTIGTAPFRRSDAFNAQLEFTDVTTLTTVKAATASKKHYITDISISLSVAGWVQIKDGTGTILCPKKYMPANSVWSKTFSTPKQTATNTTIQIIQQNAGAGSVEIDGYTV